MEDFISICLAEEKIFELGHLVAIEFVYRFQEYVGMIDSEGTVINFIWDEVGKCYFTERFPTGGSPA